MGQDDKNTIVLSDDDDDEQVQKVEKYFINEHGKRVYYYENEDFEDEEEGEEFDEEEEYDEEDEENTKWADVGLSLVLPEDHESPIFEERNEENPLQELNDMFNSLIKEGIKPDLDQDDFITDFAYGTFVKDDAPNTAINVEGVIGPITFPLSDKDVKRITDAHPTQGDSCFELETSKILLNMSFQEYIFETIFPDILSHLGVNKTAAKNSRLEARRIYICEEGKALSLPKENPKGSYASAIIILPSEYEGGELITHYDGRDKIFNSKAEHFDKCYYMTWYDNVKINTPPVEFGHRTIIYLSLIHNIDNESVTCESLQEERKAREEGRLLPAELIKSEPYADKIALYLKSLLSKSDKYPIFYMLNYTYTKEILTVDMLEKSDKALVKLMFEAAKKAGYFAYVGNFDRKVNAKVSTESHKENQNNNDECSLDEEGVYLSQSVIDDQLSMSSLFKEGKQVLSEELKINLKEIKPFIQGKSWFSRRKPDHQEYFPESNEVKYWYFTNTSIIFAPHTWELANQ